MANLEILQKQHIHFIASMAQDLGILHEMNYRNLCIKIEFEKLRKEGKTIEKIEIILSEKWSNKRKKLTPESIHRIIYQK